MYNNLPTGSKSGAPDVQSVLKKIFAKKNFLVIGLSAIAIFFLCSIPRIWEDVPNEELVVNQYPLSGKMEYWTEPGLRTQLWGRITRYKRAEQYWFGATDDYGVQQGAPISLTFNDASSGEIYGSLLVTLPTDSLHLAEIQKVYHGQQNLMNELVSQTVGKVVYSTGPLMSAFESYAEKKNDFVFYVNDQLLNGIYKTQTVEVETIDALTGETKKVRQAQLVPDENAPGGWARSEQSPFKQYGVGVSQVNITVIKYDNKVMSQIEQQQEANMQVQTAKAQAVAAVQETIKIEEQGKAAAAAAKWNQEKEKAVAVTKAEQDYEVARLEALKADEVAKRIKAEKEAEAIGNLALNRAGLTPQEKAEWDYKTKVGVAAELAKVELPKIVMTGGGNSGGMDAMNIFGLNQLMQAAEKFGNGK